MDVQPVGAPGAEGRRGRRNMVSCGGQKHPVLQLRGGAGNKTEGLWGVKLDYSRWDKLVKEVSEDEEVDRRMPRLTKFERPKRVTLRKGNAFVEDSSDEEIDFTKLKPPEMVSEEDLILQGHERSDWEHDQPLLEPEVKSWNDKSKSWNTVDYSRWDNLEVSLSEKPEDDPVVQDEIDHVHNNLVHSVRQEINEAINKHDEHGLRKALRRSEPLIISRFMDASEVSSAREILKNWTETRVGSVKIKYQYSRNRTTYEFTMNKTWVESMTRNGGKTKKYYWSQTYDDVFLHIFAPDWVRGRDVHVKVREKWIRISIHEPQVHRQDNLGVIPAFKRPLKTVLIVGKLAFRVKDGPDEHDWNIQEILDADNQTKRTIWLQLSKRPPGAEFIPATEPEWSPNYDGPGIWQDTIARVWWDRVMKEDDPVDVNEFVDRDHEGSAKFKKNWDEAHEMIRNGTVKLDKVNVTDALTQALQDGEELRIEEELKAKGVQEGTQEWKAALGQSLGRARDKLKQEREGASRLMQEFKEVDERLERELADEIPDGYSTSLNSEGEPASPYGHLRLSL